MKQQPSKSILRSFAAALLPCLLVLAGCVYSDPAASPQGKFVFPDGTGTGTVGGTPPPPVFPPGGTPPVEGSGGVSVGDPLTVSFSDMPPGSMPPEVRLRVGPDGTITLPFHVIIHCLGKTAPELSKEIRAAYVPAFFVNLTAAVRFEDRYVFVGGEVRIPQRVVYTGNSLTVLRAIDIAGGFTDFANKKKIELRRSNGKTEWVNSDKARKDSKLDLFVFPNDQITVHKKFF